MAESLRIEVPEFGPTWHRELRELREELIELAEQEEILAEQLKDLDTKSYTSSKALARDARRAAAAALDAPHP